MAIAVSYEVKNDEAFRKALLKLGKKASDLSLPLTLITKDFYKSQQAIWKLKSPGGYPDLSQATLDQRHRDGQPIYPILFKTGRLRDSMIDATHADTINTIVNKRELFLGTTVPYAIHHQFGAPKANLPMRKFLFIGPEAPRAVRNIVDGGGKGRLERWLGIINGHIKALVDRENAKSGS